MRYQSTSTAAPNIETLIDYLSSLEKAGKRFVYRGQTLDYPGPLVPSLYRRSIRLQREFTSHDDEFRHSLRQCGRRFIEMKPDSSLERLILEMKERPTIEEYHAIIELSNNPEFTALFAASGFETAVKKWVQPNHQSHVIKRRHIWKVLLDEMHRGMIRQLAFIQPFGYMLGMTLAQQYGFSSELLDFTSDLQIAAFFATHESPHYHFDGHEMVQRYGEEPGVIFCLPSAAGSIKYDRIDSRNYYSCPPQLHLDDLCMRFEDKSSPEMSDQWVGRLEEEEMIGLVNAAIPLRFQSAIHTESEIADQSLDITEAVDRYLALYYQPGTGNVRYYRLLDLPHGTYSRSRLGRQSAVAIIPDELRITEHRPGEYDYASFQAVEDVSSREGCERFYFYHTDHLPEPCQLNRDHLWPTKGDCFKMMISRVLDPSTQQYWHSNSAVPKRIDLVSNGFTDDDMSS